MTTCSSASTPPGARDRPPQRPPPAGGRGAAVRRHRHRGRARARAGADRPARPAPAGAGLHRRPRRQGRARGVRPAPRVRRAGRRGDGRPGRLGDGQPRRAGGVRRRALRRDLPEGSAATQDRVHDVAGLRIVSLDTSVPGYHHGELTDDQLAWLADVLATPAPHGTLLALHHPPIPIPMMPGRRGDRAARAGPAGRGARGHRRALHPRRPLPLLDVLHLRRHPGLGGLRDLLHLRPGAARAVRVRRRRAPGDDDGAPLRGPDRAHGRAGRRGARGERLPVRRTRAGRGPLPRGATGAALAQGLAPSTPARCRSRGSSDGGRALLGALLLRGALPRPAAREAAREVRARGRADDGLRRRHPARGRRLRADPRVEHRATAGRSSPPR